MRWSSTFALLCSLWVVALVNASTSRAGPSLAQEQQPEEEQALTTVSISGGGTRAALSAFVFLNYLNRTGWKIGTLAGLSGGSWGITSWCADPEGLAHLPENVLVGDFTNHFSRFKMVGTGGTKFGLWRNGIYDEVVRKLTRSTNSFASTDSMSSVACKCRFPLEIMVNAKSTFGTGEFDDTLIFKASCPNGDQEAKQQSVWMWKGKAPQASELRAPGERGTDIEDPRLLRCISDKYIGSKSCAREPLTAMDVLALSGSAWAAVTEKATPTVNSLTMQLLVEGKMEGEGLQAEKTVFVGSVHDAGIDCNLPLNPEWNKPDNMILMLDASDKSGDGDATGVSQCLEYWRFKHGVWFQAVDALSQDAVSTRSDSATKTIILELKEHARDTDTGYTPHWPDVRILVVFVQEPGNIRMIQDDYSTLTPGKYPVAYTSTPLGILSRIKKTLFDSTGAPSSIPDFRDRFQAHLETTFTEYFDKALARRLKRLELVRQQRHFIGAPRCTALQWLLFERGKKEMQCRLVDYKSLTLAYARGDDAIAKPKRKKKVDSLSDMVSEIPLF